MSEDELLEKDIWEYKSIRKLKSPGLHSEAICTNVQKTDDKNGKPQTSRNRKISEAKEIPKKTKKEPRQRASSVPLKSDLHFRVSSNEHLADLTSSKQKKKQKEQSTTKARAVYEGYCPSCQMPFSLLLIQTPRWHVAECLDGSRAAKKECPDGLLCTSTIPSHYKHYSHFLLAASRAGKYFAEFSSSSTENNLYRSDAAPSFSCNSFESEKTEDLNNSQDMKKPLEQFPKQSSKATCSMIITNIEASSLKNINGSERGIQSINSTKQVECSVPLSQEYESGEDLDSQHDSHRLNMFVSQAELSDCDISYSPLNTDEEAIQTEEEEEEVEESTAMVAAAQMKSSRKPLCDIEKLEERNGGNECFILNKPLCASELREFEHNNLKIIQACKANMESRDTSKAIQSADGISWPLSQGNMLSRVCCSKNHPDQMKHPTEIFTIPVECKRTKEELEQSSSTFRTGECGWGNCNEYNRISKNKVVPSESKEDSIMPLLLNKRDTEKEPNSRLDRKARTVTGTGGNKLAYNNSCSIIKKEGNICNSMAMPVFPCATSETLQCVPSANTGMQTIPTKELKQMDIGVFFGLQPKAKVESSPKKSPCAGLQTSTPSTAAGKKPSSRKRKAEGSVGDSDAITESSSKNARPADPTSGGHRRWRKKFKESCPAEEGTRKKQCPFYKKIPGTGFVVDAFQYGEIEGCMGYFLTHFHSDHYGGLTKKFTFPIYCNKITGNLVKRKLNVQEQFIHILPMDRECIINGIKVVLLDANHCPGAAMILFILTNGTVILHTGDFRADPSMECNPFLIGQKVHTLYLDTTYCSPEYTFPSQQEVIQFAVNTAFEAVTLNPRTLIVCGTYSVGKEKVFLAIAEVLGSKVSMSQEKYKTLQCLESAAINSLITLDWNNTLLHLMSMMQINFKSLQSHLNKFCGSFDHILAFKPTGWTYSNGCCSLGDIQPQTRGRITIYGIPYSEHSSFLEMKRFVQWLKPKKIIPTVNVGDWKARKEMEMHFRDWKLETTEWN
ncbi:DNA cross-link repair 1A protein [Varanus komodoensis]|uniref:DNA cross-link repair 1A protein n=1 Tax=Varanus komodoensis TaxID=61221 RepID=A0A8D2KSQ1_VARKO|nr:DNA cross-link repair 1A protein [Varanus komodoensis]XP_044295204.1 DNA cross-link repair 1A protein [Varanus komodoensis]KAF7254324.1 DNA cross-link repair 1A protein [Varanus komodoensis]